MVRTTSSTPATDGACRSRRRRIAARALAVATALTLTLSACGGNGENGSSDPNDDAPVEGAGTLTLALEAEPTSFDPSQVSSGGTPVLAWQTVYDTLLRIEPDGTVVPNAAESFELSEDATETTLVLREGMTFADGDPVDSAAVKATLERMRDGGGSDASRLADIEIENPDERTVIIRTPEPRGLMPTFLSLAPGIIANPAAFDEGNLDTEPAGSGPYVLDRGATTSGSTYTFDRNPGYWNAEAFPYDTVVLRVLEDQTARLSALRSGEIDAAFLTTQAADEAEQAGFNLVQNEVNWAGLHIVDRDGETVPALADPRVRQAMNMVFDRQAVLDAIFQGHGVVTNQIFNPGNEAYDEDLLDLYPYDVEAARELMSEAGYEDGFDLTIPDISGLNYANPIIIQQLGEININVSQQSVPPTQVISELLGGSFPVFFFTLESRNALWDVVQSLEPDSIWNVYGTEHRELAPLLEEAQVATEGDDEVFQEINRIITEEAWNVPWAFVTDTWALSTDTTAEAVLGSQAPYLYTFRPAND